MSAALASAGGVHSVVRQGECEGLTAVVCNRVGNKTDGFHCHAIRDVFTSDGRRRTVGGVIHIGQLESIGAGRIHILYREVGRWWRTGVTGGDAHIIALHIRATGG